MAYIDKIYGSAQDWDELNAFLKKNKPEYLKFLYSRPKGEGQESPLSNFSLEADEYLLENCP